MVASKLVANCTVGEDITFDAIRGQHDAVLIATGVYKSRDIRPRGGRRRGSRCRESAGLPDRQQPQKLAMMSPNSTVAS